MNREVAEREKYPVEKVHIMAAQATAGPHWRSQRTSVEPPDGPATRRAASGDSRER
jgi:hypothetical protein